MAVRYRDLVSPALIDTNVPSNGNADTAATLAQALGSFGNTVSGIGQQIMSERGKQDGSAAGAAGAPDFKSGFKKLTAYSQAYNNAALRSYTVRAEADAEDQAARLEVEAANDPVAFAATFGAVRDATLKQAPPEAKAALSEIYAKRLGDGTARLQAAQAVEIRGQQRADVSEGVARATDKIAQMLASDDPAQHLQAEEEQVKLQLLIDGAASTGTLTRTEAQAAHVTTQRAIVAQTVSAKFARELENPYGDPVGFIMKLKEANKTSDVLDPAEESKLEAQLFADLREHNALQAALHANDAAEEKARYEEGDRTATSLMLSGRLTRRKLREMVDSQNLDPSVARTLNNELDSGDKAGGDSAEAFHVRTNLLHYTEQDIATNQKLSWKERGDLILHRREESQGWKGTQAAREGEARIDRSLGIVPGTMIQSLPDDVKRARDNALTQWYNTVDGLPAEERDRAVIPSAEDVIGRFIRKQKSVEARDLRSAQQRYIDKAGDPAEMGPEQKKKYDERLRRFATEIAAAEAEAARK